MKVNVAQSSFVLLKALFPKTKFNFRMLKRYSILNAKRNQDYKILKASSETG